MGLSRGCVVLVIADRGFVDSNGSEEERKKKNQTWQIDLSPSTVRLQTRVVIDWVIVFLSVTRGSVLLQDQQNGRMH